MRTVFLILLHYTLLDLKYLYTPHFQECEKKIYEYDIFGIQGENLRAVKKYFLRKLWRKTYGFPVYNDD